jgi:hypothetical protein
VHSCNCFEHLQKGAKRNNVFTIDVSEPVDRTIIDAGAFVSLHGISFCASVSRLVVLRCISSPPLSLQADFLRTNIKVAGKAGNLGENGERHWLLSWHRMRAHCLFPRSVLAST